MIFSSAEFLFLFLACTLLGYYNPFFRGRRFRNGMVYIRFAREEKELFKLLFMYDHNFSCFATSYWRIV